jgi:putative ATP-dependent endonuclease of OLD family
MTGPASATPSTPAIYQLSIERYRGIPSLQWRPARGLNLILGGGDVGKTTILEAIALLLSPVNLANLSDPDYHDRKIDVGFSIEAILSLPLASGIS